MKDMRCGFIFVLTVLFFTLSDESLLLPFQLTFVSFEKDIDHRQDACYLTALLNELERDKYYNMSYSSLYREQSFAEDNCKGTFRFESSITNVHMKHDILSLMTVKELRIQSLYQNANELFKVDSCLAFLQSQIVLVYIEPSPDGNSHDIMSQKDLLLKLIEVLPKHSRPRVLSWHYSYARTNVDSLIDLIANTSAAHSHNSGRTLPPHVSTEFEMTLPVETVYTLRELAPQHYNKMKQSLLMLAQESSDVDEYLQKQSKCNLSVEDNLVLSKIKVHQHQLNAYNFSSSLDALDGSSELFINEASRPSTSRSKLLCIAYTTSVDHSRVADILGSWGAKCDGYVAFSNLTDMTLSIVEVKPYDSWVEDYNNMWTKSQFIWKIIAASLLDDYDYFLMGGDDLFVIVENLRALLDSHYLNELSANGTLPIYLGKIMNQNHYLRFVSGGSGYVLNRVAVAVLVSLLHGGSSGSPELTEASSSCLTEIKSFMEDLLVAQCLLQVGIHPVGPAHIRAIMREVFAPDPSHTTTESERSAAAAAAASEGDVDVVDSFFYEEIFIPVSPKSAFRGDTYDW